MLAPVRARHKISIEFYIKLRGLLPAGQNGWRFRRDNDPLKFKSGCCSFAGIIRRLNSHCPAVPQFME